MSSIGVFSGIASGIDWREMIDQIIQIDSRPIRLLDTQINRLDQQSRAWSAFRSALDRFDAALKPLADQSAFQKLGVTLRGDEPPLRVSAGTAAVAGSYEVVVHALATREKLGGAVVASRTEALGYEGEFLINGVRIEVEASDSLDDLAAKINAVSAGRGGAKVNASVLSTATDAHRLILTSEESGARGIDLVDGSAGLLRDLGFLDASPGSLKHATSSGFMSDGFRDATAAVATLLGLQNPPAAGTVSIGGLSVDIDLSTDSLSDIAARINAAAGAAGSGISARVVEESIDNGSVQRLEVSGTTSYGDADRILEVLGVVQGGRSAVAQQVRSTMGLAAGGAAAESSTRFVDLDSGPVVGDTLSVRGTRADGSTFSFDFTIEGTTTIQDLLDRLNDEQSGFRAGDRTALATIDAEGRIVVTDDVGGESQLALSIVAHNEGGGTLDFGRFDLVQTGRAREIAKGTDAVIEIDGSMIRRSTNRIDDALPGLTFDLDRAAPETTTTVEVWRDNNHTVQRITAFVDAYNALADFVGQQLGGGEPGQSRPPLAGDSVLRSISAQFKEVMQRTIGGGIAGDYTRLADIGIEVDKTGRFQVDSDKLRAAVDSDPLAVSRLFADYGTGSRGTITYLSAGDATRAGTYSIEITQIATQGSALGTGFAGTYVDDGVPDTLHIRDIGSDKTYSVSLSNGMTISEIVAALNAEFGKAQRHRIEAANALHSAADGTPVSDATTWGSIYHGDGNSAGVQDGDTITLSGTRTDGSAFLATYEIRDAATQSVGEFRTFVQELVGNDVVVSFENGVLRVEALETGSSLITLAVTANNEGGGTLDFGSLDVTVQGRPRARMTASENGGQLEIRHHEYGSSAGFEISFDAGGNDGSASLGLAAGTYEGEDVQGMIGGLAAKGRGQLLIGEEGTAAEGMIVRYTGEMTGAVGDVTFSRGIAAALRLTAEPLLAMGRPGSIQDTTQRLGERITRIEDRILAMEERLERRREAMIRRFVALEQVMAQAQAQSQWLMAQIGGLGL